MLAERNAHTGVDTSAVPDAIPIVIERFTSEIRSDFAISNRDWPFNLELIAVPMGFDAIDAPKLETIPIAYHESLLERCAGREVEKETVLMSVVSSGRLAPAVAVIR